MGQWAIYKDREDIKLFPYKVVEPKVGSKTVEKASARTGLGQGCQFTRSGTLMVDASTHYAAADHEDEGEAGEEHGGQTRAGVRIGV